MHLLKDQANAVPPMHKQVRNIKGKIAEAFSTSLEDETPSNVDMYVERRSMPMSHSKKITLGSLARKFEENSKMASLSERGAEPTVIVSKHKRGGYEYEPVSNENEITKKNGWEIMTHGHEPVYESNSDFAVWAREKVEYEENKAEALAIAALAAKSKTHHHRHHHHHHSHKKNETNAPAPEEVSAPVPAPAKGVLIHKVEHQHKEVPFYALPTASPSPTGPQEGYCVGCTSGAGHCISANGICQDKVSEGFCPIGMQLCSADGGLFSDAVIATASPAPSAPLIYDDFGLSDGGNSGEVDANNVNVIADGGTPDVWSPASFSPAGSPTPTNSPLPDVCNNCSHSSAGPCQDPFTLVCHPMYKDKCPVGTMECPLTPGKLSENHICHECLGSSYGDCMDANKICYHSLTGVCPSDTFMCDAETGVADIPAPTPRDPNASPNPAKPSYSPWPSWGPVDTPAVGGSGGGMHLSSPGPTISPNTQSCPECFGRTWGLCRNSQTLECFQFDNAGQCPIGTELCANTVPVGWLPYFSNQQP